MTNEGKIVKAEIFLPERELRMPDGTPLGLGILGAAKFSAIRRVLDYAARAEYAKANLHTAQAATASALVARERARNQLSNINEICEDDTKRFTEGAEILSLRRRLEKIELEDQIADREARRERLRGATKDQQAQVGGMARDDFAAFISDLQRLPEVAKAVSAAKEQIVKNAGGEEKMSEADKAVCDMFDAMLQSFASKKAGDTAL
jgi:hypothetical protein